MDVMLNGKPLTADEIAALLAGKEGLQWIRGQWVEVDRDRLESLIARFEGIKDATADGLPFGQAMCLLSGAALNDSVPADPDWSEVVAGDWLADLLRGLRSPEGLAAVTPGPALRATLRPYQEAGVRWLHLLSRLGLGACLADDMGLGKTIQVLALLLTLERRHPSLLVAPASLLTNWQQEAERFTPTLRCVIAHPSVMAQKELRALDAERIPFFVLSLKAGGTGLNLTAAVHVVHFDRWWNPAVENQATDRAWRIGQHRNVLVHKFVCRGTIEERIDDLIRSKQQLVKDVIEGGSELNLTEMSDAELLDLVKLDIHTIGE